MRKWIIIVLSSVVGVIILGFAGLYYYQATRFNAGVTIDHINVGRMTADQALNKLQSKVLKNIVYVGKNQVFDGKDTAMGFTNADLPEVQKLLHQQKTFFPSSKAINYTIVPKNADQNQIQNMKESIQKKLVSMNKGLKAPKDAEARIRNGQIVVSKSVKGDQYDVAQELKEFDQQEYESEIHLKPVYKQPLTAASLIVKQEKNKLGALLQQTVNYNLQNKPYPFKGSEVIQNASINKEMKYTIDPSGIKKKLSEINASQSTLNKNYTFKTHSGKIISVKSQTYGWAIDIPKEAKRIENAFEKGQQSILAYNIYGKGWSTYGIGYHVTSNHGIGNTYVEVSIEQQRIWVYKDGKLKLTTPVVTGTHIYNEDTPKGVWYIEYKQSPSTLVGSEVGDSNYSVKVAFWAPFTMSGCGFHDASWRTNWSSTAYIAQGSGGCVNTPPSVMKQVYENVEQNEPVVVY